jgi:tetratricopeptide (TPR) repeat protein
MHPSSRDPVEGSRIESWKEIAAFFGRDERTVKRWEKTRNLPVYRLPGDKGGVFAYAKELRIWLNSATNQKTATRDAAPDKPGQLDKQEISDNLGNPPQDAARAPIPESASPPRVPLSAAAPLQVHEAISLNTVFANRPPRGRAVLLWSIPLAVIVLFAVLGLLHFVRPTHGMTTPNPKGISGSARPADSLAQESYLKGRYYWNRRTDDSLRQAVDAFTQAVVRDSQYAPAYAGLADSYDLMPQYTSMPRSQAFPMAISAARKAVALDDSLSEAHRALAFGLFYWEWDVNAAFREYQRAIDLDPKDVEAHNWYATSLMHSRHLSAAIAEIEKARELDPTSRIILANQAIILSVNGDRQQSVARLKELENAEPDFLAPVQYLTQIFFDDRNYPAYIAEIKRAAAISREPEKAALAEAAERGWSHGGERGLLEQVQIVYRHSFLSGQSSGYDLARVCALLGQKADADRYLQAAVDAHDFDAMTVFYGDFNAHMKGDPGFERIEQQIKLRMNRSPAVNPGAGL